MNNGEKKEFMEKVKLFFRLVLSPQIMKEVAADMQREYDEELRRNAAHQEERERGKHHNGLNHCES